MPKEYLHSAELRDIMQFGSSASAVFFKMRVAGVLHIFQFDTRQGEDICMALQTHINDIMMKRYSKVSLSQTLSRLGLEAYDECADNEARQLDSPSSSSRRNSSQQRFHVDAWATLELSFRPGAASRTVVSSALAFVRRDGSEPQ